MRLKVGWDADGFGQLLKRQAAALPPLPYVGGSYAP